MNGWTVWKMVASEMDNKEYIERGALKQEIESHMTRVAAESGGEPENPVIRGYLLGKNHAIDCVEQATTADVVEVVRCKDCRFCESGKIMGGASYFACRCQELLGEYAESIAVYSDDFCSYGKRRECTDGADHARND